MDKVVRVAVLGDTGVGKTSLISTAANDTFDVRPPPVLPPTRLPPEFTPDHTAMLITDTSSRPEDQQTLDLVISQSDVVVVCFDSKRPSTLDSVRTFWYGRIQKLNADIPVILACCKADLLDENREMQPLREKVERAVHDLPNVEVCLNCSAQTLRMVADVFHYALKSVLYPLQPLYDRMERRLRPLCSRALKRVFIMCDKDSDGTLNDAELNEFQRVCFNVHLTDEELQNVKQVVQSKMPGGVREDGLTLDGFLFLHVLFIERGRLESVWAVLRRFGYNDELKLSDEAVDKLNFSLPLDSVYELSERALLYLSKLFANYDDDNDGLVSHEQLQAMFSTLPQPAWQGDRWSRTLVSGTYGATHTREAFMVKWQYQCLMDPRSTLAQLMYLGYDPTVKAHEASTMLIKMPRRRSDKKHDLTSRSTMHAYVFGSSGCGKSTLLRALAGRVAGDSSLPVATAAATGGLTAVGAVDVDNGSKTLVMTEVSEDILTEFLMLSKLAASSGASPATTVTTMPDLSKADVAVFIFDSSSEDSWQKAYEGLIGVAAATGDTLPCVLIASKEDLGIAAKLAAEVTDAATALGIAPVINISSESAEQSNAFRQILHASCHPERFIPDTPRRKERRTATRVMFLTLGGCVAASVAAFALWRLLSRKHGGVIIGGTTVSTPPSAPQHGPGGPPTPATDSLTPDLLARPPAPAPAPPPSGPAKFLGGMQIPREYIDFAKEGLKNFGALMEFLPYLI